MATKLSVVNNVLRRLRERTVVSTAATDYATLIGNFCDDVRREVEDAYNWNSLRTTIVVTTIANIYEYSLTGIGERFKVIDVIGNPGGMDFFCNAVHTSQLTHWFLAQNPAKGLPQYYGFNGLDSNGDTKVDIYPIPDKVYTYNFNVVIPQSITLNDADQIIVPSYLVELGTLAKAYWERGDAMADQYKSAQAQYLDAVKSAISQEEAYLPYETDWIAV